ncbi:MAG: PcfK-like family protein [Lachnospiraceae bacterium]|nr:PcfK-like family protein [Lachnospiraceae bacterium]
MIEGMIKNRQDLNQVAEHLRARGETERIKKLAYEWLLPEKNVDDFIAGKRFRLADEDVEEKEYAAINEKLADEMAMLFDGAFADVIGIYVSKKCLDECYAMLALQPHKSLRKCLDYVLEKAYKIAEKRREKQPEAGNRIGVSVSNETVYQWVDEYYALDDKKEEAEKKEKARQDFIQKRKSREDSARRAVQNAKKSKKRTGSAGKSDSAKASGAATVTAVAAETEAPEMHITEAEPAGNGSAAQKSEESKQMDIFDYMNLTDTSGNSEDEWEGDVSA